MRLRSVASLVLVALIAGAIAAHADSGSAPRPARAPVARVVPAPATRPFLRRARCGGLRMRRAGSDRSPAPDAPGRARRPRRRAAVAGAARRLRDPGPPAHRPGRAAAAGPHRPARARAVAGVARLGAPVAQHAVGRARVGRPGARRGRQAVGLRLPARREVRAARGPGRRGDRRRRERGRRRSGRPRPRAFAATVAPCAGADHSMLSISGIVPNGVPAVFLTAPDGTAVRADVKDNGYEFLLPKQRTAEQRYVVWTGGDGTPHVQPVVAFGRWTAKACASAAKRSQSMARVSPDALSGCVTPRDHRQDGGTAAAPRIARAAPSPSGRPAALRHALLARRPVHAGRRRHRPSAPAPPVAVLPARPAPPAVAARAGAGALGRAAGAQAPLTLRRAPQVASARWLLPALSWSSRSSRSPSPPCRSRSSPGSPSRSHTRHVVDKADGVADDAALAIRRLDRTTRELDPAVRSLRRAADALSEARTTP